MKMKKRFLGILLSFMMVLGLLPGMSLTAFAGENYNLYVGGTQVTSANAGNIDGNNKASYNAETKTLTLNGYSYSGNGYSFDYGSYASIYAGDLENLTIVLSGTNSITNTAGSCGYAIRTETDLTITGSGTLIAAATTGESCTGIYSSNGKVDISGITVTASGSDGISYGKSSTFKNSTVEATGHSRDGIYGSSGLLTIEGGKLTAKGESNGIDAMYGLWVQESAIVEADGGRNGITCSGTREL